MFDEIITCPECDSTDIILISCYDDFDEYECGYCGVRFDLEF